MELETAFQEIEGNGFNQLPVIKNDNVEGILSREDVISYLQMLREFEV